MSKIYYVSDADFEIQFAKLYHSKEEMSPAVIKTVQDILNDVQNNGDKAVFQYTEKFDNVSLSADTIKFSATEIQDAVNSCSADILNALSHAKDRIKSFHTATLPSPICYTDDIGVHLEMRYTPIARVGLYVPGGTASYPSSVIMNAVPAKVAGVRDIAMCVPTPNGHINPYVLAAAHIVGVSEIYKIGGAQAIGALAYGTQTIPKVLQITGPGNAYVAAAKRHVYGIVGVDMIAGPSEVLIVADKTANPEWVATDILAQAEHDVSAQALVITDDASLAQEILKQVERILPTLPRHNIAKSSWENNGAVLCIDHIHNAYPYIDKIASEHLELCVHNAKTYSKRVQNAGAIFLGNTTPEAIGDYIGGPNHVLPTARSASFASGLGVMDFMKRTSVLGCSVNALAHIGPDAVKLAKTEGLDAHALSVMKRLDS